MVGKVDVPRRDAALVGDAGKKFRPRRSVICFRCKKAGHIQRDCPERKKSPHKADVAVEEEESNSASLLLLIVLKQTNG